MSLEPGGAIGQYRIVEQLGRGGMATVYKGYHARLDRFVAIKVLPAYFAEEPGFAERFAQEAVMIARFDHPNILTVHDYGEENGISYLVMAYVDGGTLAERVGEPMPAHEVAGIIRPIASALDYAHDRGILHRDIKPANVLLRRDGAPVLADFGIAKMTDQTRGLTRTGAVVGTPEYMAPEQAMGEPAGVAADQYALGVVAYELLTGRVPYRAETPVAVLLAHAHKELPHPRTVNPNISLSVETALTKALAKRPQDRYPNAMAFADALVKAAAPTAAAAATTDATQHVTIDTLRGSAQPVVRQMRGYWDRFVAPSLTNIVQPPMASPASGSPTHAQRTPSGSTPTPPPTVAGGVSATINASTGVPPVHDAPTVLDTTPTGPEATSVPLSPIASVEPSSAPNEERPAVHMPSTVGDQDRIAHPTEVVEPLGSSSSSNKAPDATESAETVFVSGSDVDNSRQGVDSEWALPMPPQASSAEHEALLAEIHGRPAPLPTSEATVIHAEPAAEAVMPPPVTDKHALATTTTGPAAGSVDSYVENLSASLPPAPVAFIDLYVRFAPMTAIVVGGLGVAILVVFRLLSSVGASVISLFGGVVGTPAASTSFLLIALGLIVGVLTIYGGRQMQGLRALGWWALSTALVLGVVERTLAHVWAGVLLTLVVAYVHLLAKPRYR